MSIEPRFKEGRPVKARPKGLNRVGKKTQRDLDELAVSIPIIKERSRGRCEAAWSDLCTGRGEHAHHIVRRSAGGTNDPDNLLWVCWFDHDRIHSNPAEALVRGLLRPFGYTDGDAA